MRLSPLWSFGRTFMSSRLVPCILCLAALFSIGFSKPLASVGQSDLGDKPSNNSALNEADGNTTLEFTPWPDPPFYVPFGNPGDTVQYMKLGPQPALPVLDAAFHDLVRMLDIRLTYEWSYGAISIYACGLGVADHVRGDYALILSTDVLGASHGNFAPESRTILCALDNLVTQHSLRPLASAILSPKLSRGLLGVSMPTVYPGWERYQAFFLAPSWAPGILLERARDFTDIQRAYDEAEVMATWSDVIRNTSSLPAQETFRSFTYTFTTNGGGTPRSAYVFELLPSDNAESVAFPMTNADAFTILREFFSFFVEFGPLNAAFAILRRQQDALFSWGYISFQEIGRPGAAFMNQTEGYNTTSLAGGLVALTLSNAKLGSSVTEVA